MTTSLRPWRSTRHMTREDLLVEIGILRSENTNLRRRMGHHRYQVRAARGALVALNAALDVHPEAEPVERPPAEEDPREVLGIDFEAFEARCRAERGES